MNRSRFCAAIAFIAAVACLALLLVLVHQTVLPIVAWAFPSLRTSFYDLAVYGAYPTRSYVSFDYGSPAPSILRWDESCDNGYILIGPQGNSVSSPGPMILDAQGELVWMSAEYGLVMNVKVQRYRGKDYLTFWAGEKTGGEGRGNYYMLDSSYNLFKKVSAVGEANHGDLHEFKLTDNGTALMTIYNRTNADLSPMGWGRSATGWITDSVFQEVDIETGDLIFEWKASEHFDPAETYYWAPFAGYGESRPLDFYHLNSIDKDSQGNYLICSRHTHSITTLSPTGDVLWILGGSLNQFEDLSDGEATNFMWQHDARWISEEEGLISVFDNGGAGPMQYSGDYGKGRVIKLDLEKHTATLVHSYATLGKALSASQGSVQFLPENDHVFVGYGSAGAWTEHDPNGDLLCETHIGAASLFWWERVKSYRTIKVLDWVGKPQYPPVARIYRDRMYVSWNGATEVVSWEVRGVLADDDDQAPQDSVSLGLYEKTGFETNFELPLADDYTAYRVVALDEYGNVLSTSAVVTDDGLGYRFFKALAWICGAIGLLIGLWIGVTKVLRKRKDSIFSWEMYRYSRL